ncbi:helicase [Clostridium sp. CT7]|nr:helicase [Clostridium sp. CT7]
MYENVRKELLGPGSEDIGSDVEHEFITDPPISRYSTGILFPQDLNMGQEVKGNVDLEDDSNNYQEEQEHQKGLNANGKIEFQLYENDNVEAQEFEEKISMTNEKKPSSMGFTFFAKGDVKELVVRLKGAKYRKCKLEDCCVRYSGEDYFEHNGLKEYIERKEENLIIKKEFPTNIIDEYKDDEKYKEDDEYKSFITVLYALSRQINCIKNGKGYVREPISFSDVLNIKLNQNGNYTVHDVMPKKFLSSNGEEMEMDLQVSIYTKEYQNSIRSYTVILVNNEKFKHYGRDLKSIFQPEIRILSEDNKQMTFIHNRNNSIVDFNKDLDEEEQLLEVLYSKKKNYAVGHGVSVMEEMDSFGSLKELKTTYIPTYKVKGIKFDMEGISKDQSNIILSMKNLSDYSNLSKNEVILNLETIVKLYNNWIYNLEKEITSFKDEYKKFTHIARCQIEECKICSERIEKGINILSENEQAYFAFQLMNRALMMQRVQGKSSQKERYPDDDEIKYPNVDFKKVSPDEAIWRPFQLAYILMCLESIVDPKCSDRNLVDLIWVPTGGGKTEAYLGLTAFTIFLRRLKDKNNGGTTVIMRYTLRLLAAQQFTRASILICACELIRREMKGKLGKEKITIGLWIGSNQTPNKKSDAKNDCKELRYSTRSADVLNRNKAQYNKFQVLKCPWCGTKLERDIKYNDKIKKYDSPKGDWGYEFTGKVNKIFCPEDECIFNSALPIEVVDECIYEKPPTLLFGTVDKFAMITWNEGSGSLFGIGSKNNKSPELIIQDELHLISGPLGTLVGEYETAVDILCSQNENNIKPKIIASTATIRNAKEQCRQLYARDVKQFPPSGLYEDDSFFTKEDKTSFGRQYVGIMPSGKTLTTTQVRLMSVLTNKVNVMNLSDKVKSKYWTLVGYFNTIKELGMTRSLINADIQNNINAVSTRILKYNKARRLYYIAELTSRVSSNTINNTLKNLEVEYSKENKDDKKYAIDVLLASNMISVGVDVSRLNLMMVLEQPKLTSEYIQATSRVGRENPGIIFTLYNPTRSRDKSYYEMFHDYHQSFYKYVEPTSVTPFSEPARERMLHSVFIALIRHAVGLSSEVAAGSFDSIDNSVIDKCRNKIIERAEKILNLSESDEEIQNIKEEINLFCKEWKEKIDKYDGRIKYSKNRSANNEDNYGYLIRPFGKKVKTEKPTLQSMRNVDKQGTVEILQFGDDADE